MGADVLRVDRAVDGELGFGRERRFDVMLPRPPVGGARPQEPGRRRAALRLAEQADAIDRGVPPRRDGAARPRPRRLLGAQPAAGLRPHDRLGPGRPARAARRPRHRLHRALRRAARDRPRRRGAGAAAQPGRRLRRRRHAAGLRHRLRRDRGARERPRPGRRRGDGRRRGRALDDVRRPRGGGPVERDARRQRARLAARPGTTPTRRATAGTSPSARSSRSSSPSCVARLGLDASLRRRSRTIARPGRDCAAGSPRASRSEAATNGSRSSRAPTRASRPSSPSPSRVRIRTSSRARAASRSAASTQPAPAPRFGARRGAVRTPPPERGGGGAAALARLGLRCAGHRRAVGARRRLRALAVGRAATSGRPASSARRSACSFSRCAVSERSAIGCSCVGHVGVDLGEQRRHRRRAERLERRDDLGLALQGDGRRSPSIAVARLGHQEAVAGREPVEVERRAARAATRGRPPCRRRAD